MDQRIEIPTECYVNVHIIDRLLIDRLPAEPFTEYCTTVATDLGFRFPNGLKWPFVNLSWTAYMMYCLLVVPKELYELNNDDAFFKGLLDQQAMRLFTIKKERYKFEKNPSYHLNCLRNAVSHVNFRIDEQKKYTFWDHPRDKPDARHWEAEIGYNDLMHFLLVVAAAAHRVALDIREGRRKPLTST